jgi:hypothetical protein
MSIYYIYYTILHPVLKLRLVFASPAAFFILARMPLVLARSYGELVKPGTMGFYRIYMGFNAVFIGFDGIYMGLIY